MAVEMLKTSFPILISNHLRATLIYIHQFSGHGKDGSNILKNYFEINIFSCLSLFSGMHNLFMILFQQRYLHVFNIFLQTYQHVFNRKLTNYDNKQQIDRQVA